MAAITTFELIYTDGVNNPTFVAAASSDDFEAPNRAGQMYAHYKNTNAASRTLTVTVPGTNVYAAANPDPTYTLDATTGEVLIPLHPTWANTSGRIDIAVSAITNVTVTCVKLPI